MFEFKFCYLTIPQILNRTATNLEIVKRSPRFDGNMAASSKVNNPELEDNTVTTPASVFAKATWYV